VGVFIPKVVFSKKNFGKKNGTIYLLAPNLMFFNHDIYLYT